MVVIPVSDMHCGIVGKASSPPLLLHVNESALCAIYLICQKITFNHFSHNNLIHVVVAVAAPIVIQHQQPAADHGWYHLSRSFRVRQFAHFCYLIPQSLTTLLIETILNWVWKHSFPAVVVALCLARWGSNAQAQKLSTHPTFDDHRNSWKDWVVGHVMTTSYY